MRLLQLTDLHVFAEAHAKLKGIPTRECLQDVLKFIKQHETPFDHVFVTGDHTHDEQRSSYDVVHNLLTQTFGTFESVPGNHDDRRILRDAFGETVSGQGDQLINFDVDCGSWQCIGLDTHVPGSVAGKIDTAQIQWAKDRIGSRNASSVALFCHHPPVEVNSVWMDKIGLEGRELVAEWLQSEPRIRLVCCGHVHHEFQTRLGNADIYTTPSTGIQFNPSGDTPSFSPEAPGYRVIELNGNTMSTHVVRLPEIRYRPDVD